MMLLQATTEMTQTAVETATQLEKLGFLGFSLFLNVVLSGLWIFTVRYFSKRIDERDIAIAELTKLSKEVQDSMKETIATFKQALSADIKVQMADSLSKMENKFGEIQKTIIDTLLKLKG